MKRAGNLFEQVVAWPNLVLAARRARRGKRSFHNVATFEFGIEYELSLLRSQLLDGSYRPGKYKTFEVHVPKPRLISAAPYRDRVVHHAICNIIEPIMDRWLIHDSYACRVGKGAHAAVRRAIQYAKSSLFVLKVDLQKYFPSIDHVLLKSSIQRKIKDQRVLGLINQIIDTSNPQPETNWWFPGDDLFTPWERRRGLPIGNLTSQLFANWMLNEFDHYVVERLQVPYVRYCDDMLFFGRSSADLSELRSHVGSWLANRRLRIHQNKSVVYRTDCGFNFLGYRLFPFGCLIDKRNVCRFRRRMREVQKHFALGLIDAKEVGQRIHSWLGHVGHTRSARIVERTLDRLIFTRSRPDESPNFSRPLRGQSGYEEGKKG